MRSRRAAQSEVIEKWWPTTQSMDLVLGDTAAVALAVESEVRGYLCGESAVASWRTFTTLDEAFGTTTEFGNVPTRFLVLPTRSPWTVLWNNGFLCGGYDSLCSNLTRKHGFVTVHWVAHDEETTTEPHAMFIHRRSTGDGVAERYIYVARGGKRWSFYDRGESIPEEDTSAYLATRKRDRLGEETSCSCSPGSARPRGARTSTPSPTSPPSASAAPTRQRP